MRADQVLGFGTMMDFLEINKFGFGVYADQVVAAESEDVADLLRTLEAIAAMVLAEDELFVDSLSDDAVAGFIVPLQMANVMLRRGGYSAVDLVAASGVVRYTAQRYLLEFPADLVELLQRLPR
ncbi:hypothetical protein [Catellatospora coxensis]|uniref:Uncharacterized protein n=2 Tax=Catellatospora coxensis TaxID=310354 RepID=A0A8J3P8E7_9ACTN|nr:hypothetical protein [Catellatospora coxensis]GIG07429.1 hypothetical protein Cco03nite_41290 [Catellatospora coxensis]